MTGMMRERRGHKEVFTPVRGSEKDSGSTSSLNPVSNPTGCFKINCLQFICRTVRCRLHKRPSVRTIICGRLPLRPFYTNENNYVPDKMDMERFIEFLKSGEWNSMYKTTFDEVS